MENMMTKEQYVAVLADFVLQNLPEGTRNQDNIVHRFNPGLFVDRIYLDIRSTSSNGICYDPEVNLTLKLIQGNGKIDPDTGSLVSMLHAEVSVSWPSYSSVSCQTSKSYVAMIAGGQELAEKIEAQFGQPVDVIWSTKEEVAKEIAQAEAENLLRERANTRGHLYRLLHTEISHMRVGHRRLLNVPLQQLLPLQLVNGDYLIEINERTFSIKVQDNLIEYTRTD